MFLGQKGASIRSIFEYALYAFFILFPFLSINKYLYGPASGRAMIMMFLVEILAIILGLVLFKKDLTLKIFRSPILLVLLLYLMAIIASSLFGIDASVSMWSKAPRISGIFYLIHLAFFLISLIMIIWNDETKKKLIKIILVSTGIYSILALVGPEGFHWIYKTKQWDGFSFGNSSFAGMYLFATFLLSVYFVATHGKRKWYHYLIPFTYLINPTILNAKLWVGKINIFHNPLGIIGEAQASAYALFASIIILSGAYIISKIKDVNLRKKISIGCVIVGAITITVVIYSLLNPDGLIHKKYLVQSSGARPIVWQLAKEAMNEKPIFGWGMDNFDKAFEAHYDNRLLEEKNGAEAWFDRAHNIIIDQRVDTGYLGLSMYLLIYITIILCMVYVIFKSQLKNDQVMAVILITYFTLHLAELQTAFDTVISYPIIALMLALGIATFHRTYTTEKTEMKTEWNVPKWARYSGGMLLIGLFVWAMIWGTIPIWRSEVAFARIHGAGSSEKRIPYYDSALSSPMDLPSFVWRISTDLQRGIADNPTIIENAKERQGFIKEFSAYADAYKKYNEKHPNDYRAKLNLADVLIYQRLFDIDKLQEAEDVLDTAINQNPSIPQAYWMKSVAYLYMAKFDLARTWAKKALDINPNIELSQELVKYIDDSVRTFPDIDLYFFTQI